MASSQSINKPDILDMDQTVHQTQIDHPRRIPSTRPAPTIYPAQHIGHHLHHHPPPRSTRLLPSHVDTISGFAQPLHQSSPVDAESPTAAYPLPSPASSVDTMAPLLPSPRPDFDRGRRIAHCRRHRHKSSKRSRSRRHSSWMTVMCASSGILLIAILTTYLALLLNVPDIGVGINIFFVLLLILAVIIFSHSVLRLCLRRYHNETRRTREHARSRHHRCCRHRRHRQVSEYPAEHWHPSDLIPAADTVYSPTTPVRVHLARDEDGLFGEMDKENVDVDESVDLELGVPASETHLVGSAQYVRAPSMLDLYTASPLSPTAPPPAYGLWRCSVRADPNLLHWTRVGLPLRHQSLPVTLPTGRYASSHADVLPRPPSYTSAPPANSSSTPSVISVPRLSLHITPDLGANEMHQREPEIQEIPVDWPLRTPTVVADEHDAEMASRVRGSVAVQEATRHLLQQRIYEIMN